MIMCRYCSVGTGPPSLLVGGRGGNVPLVPPSPPPPPVPMPMSIYNTYLFTYYYYNTVVQCPDLSDSIENGKVVVTPPARTVNSTAKYSCNDGYKLDKGDVKRTCQDEGTWSGQAPQCSE